MLCPSIHPFVMYYIVVVLFCNLRSARPSFVFIYPSSLEYLRHGKEAVLDLCLHPVQPVTGRPEAGLATGHGGTVCRGVRCREDYQCGGSYGKNCACVMSHSYLTFSVVMITFCCIEKNHLLFYLVYFCIILKSTYKVCKK